MSDKLKATLKRFIRMFVFSGFVSMGAITIKQVLTWQEVIPILSNLLLAFVIGGITGVIAGYDKWLRWEE